MNLIEKQSRIKEVPYDPNMYIAVDFDGVIHDIDYSNYIDYKHFNVPFEGASKYLKLLKNQGWKIIIWTCRKKSRAMKKWLKENDIPYDSINKNISKVFKGQSVKVYADVYLDDKNIEYLGTPGYNWETTYNTILEKFKSFYIGGRIFRK